MIDRGASLINCYSLLGLHVNADTCSSVKASIIAANIQADAALWAGGMTIIAAVIALLAGYFTIHAAELQIKNDKNEKFSESACFALMLWTALNDCCDEIGKFEKSCRLKIEEIEKYSRLSLIDLNNSEFDELKITTLCDVISIKNWKSLSALSPDLVSECAVLGSSLTYSVRSLVFMRNKNDDLHSNYMTAFDQHLMREKFPKYHDEIIKKLETVADSCLECIPSIHSIHSMMIKTYDSKLFYI